MADYHKPGTNILLRLSYEMGGALNEVVKESGLSRTDYIKRLIADDLKRNGKEVNVNVK